MENRESQENQSGAVQLPMTRKRRFHTRSRAGCTTCKQRRVRCDEGRPVCGNCLFGRRNCRYQAISLPLSELRRQETWAPGITIWQIPQADGLEPFDCLPIEMKLHSRKLLHYFIHTDWEVEKAGYHHTSTLKALPDSVEWTAREPVGFRIMLLVAAIHYCWQTGSFDVFQDTFISHKVESIQLVNGWLAEGSSSTSADCMRLVTMLAVAECCVGNIPTAEAHLDGLVTLMELRESRPSKKREDSANSRLAERLFLGATLFVHAVKSRLSQISVEQLNEFQPVWQTSFTATVENLAAMRLFPFFLLKNDDDRLPAHDIDVTLLLAALRRVDEAISRPHAMEAPHHILNPALAPHVNICDGTDATSCPGCRSMSGLFYANTRALTESLLPPAGGTDAAAAPEPALPSLWSGVMAAGGIYMNMVKGIWELGVPVEPRMFRQFFAAVKRDVDRSESATFASASTARHQLWFWKVFNAALGLRVVWDVYGRPGREIRTEEKKGQDAERGGGEQGGQGAGAPGHKRDSVFKLNSADMDWAEAGIRKWSVVSGIVDWKDARAALTEIAWAEPALRESTARDVWETATSDLKKKPRLFPRRAPS